MSFDAFVRGVVNASINKIFGDGSNAGTLGNYKPVASAAFDLDGVFDEAWAHVEFPQGRFGRSVPVSTTKPRFLVRLSDFPLGVTPKPGDQYTRPNGDLYTVQDVNPDSFGAAYLILTKTAA